MYPLLLSVALRMSNGFLVGQTNDGTEVTISRKLNSDRDQFVLEMSPYVKSYGRNMQEILTGRVQPYFRVVREVTDLKGQLVRYETIPDESRGLPLWNEQSDHISEFAINEAIEKPEKWYGKEETMGATITYSDSLSGQIEVCSMLDMTTGRHVLYRHTEEMLYLQTFWGEVLVLTRLRHCRVMVPAGSEESQPLRYTDFGGFIIR